MYDTIDPQVSQKTYTYGYSYRLFLMAYLFMLSTSFNLLNIGGRNFIFIGGTFLIAVFFLLVQYKRFPNVFSTTVFYLLVYVIFSFLVNNGNASFSSFFYSVFFISSYLLLTRVCIRFLDRDDFRNLIEFILFSYFIGILIGQIYVLFGFFDPTAGAYEGHGLFGTAFSTDSNSIRFYSLSTEPSYASIIVVFLYYLFLKISTSQIFDKKKIIVSIVVFYMVVVFSSGYGFLLFGILLWLQLQKLKPDYAFASFIVLLVVFSIIFFVDFDVYGISRIKNIITNFNLFDWTFIRDVDYSASFRVLPFYYYLKSIDFTSIHFYFGYGAGVSETFLSKDLFPHATEIVSFQGGFLPGFLIDYGIAGFLIFALSFFKETKVLFSFGLIVMLFTMTNANLNTQLFWVVFTFLYLEKRIISI